MRRQDSIAATDQEALQTLLTIHAVPEPRILDCTANRGRVWRGLDYQVHRADIDPRWHQAGLTDTVADFRRLPFEDGSFDVMVFDPPHITDAGSGIVGAEQWGDSYGTRGAELRALNISHLFDPFVCEARRVLTQDVGIVIAKIANQVHGGRYQDQARMLKNLAEQAGMTHCDEMLTISYSRGGLVDPRWKRIYHCRQVHAFWVVLRNGKSCMSIHAPNVERYETDDIFNGVA